MHRPDVTQAQLVAALVAGVPILSNLLAAFGVFAPSPQQQHALTEALTWAIPFAGLLIAGDAHLRAARNHAQAAAAPIVVEHPTAPDDVEGPGDPDQLPHLKVADPGKVPADEGDAGAVK